MFARKSLYLLFLAGAVFALGAPTPNAGRLELFHGIAEGNYLIGDLKGAANGVEEILKIDPDHVPALALKARVLLDDGDPESALAAARRVRGLAPERLEYVLLEALVLGNLGRHKEATARIESVLEKAAPGTRDFRAAHQLLGLLRMAEGEWDAAAEAFNQLYLDSTDEADPALQLASEAYLEKARDHLSGGETERAIQAIDEAIAVYAHTTGAESLHQRTALRMMRARVFARAGDFDAAIRGLQLLTGQQPDNIEAVITLASLYASAGRWSSLDGVLERLSAEPTLQDITLYLEGRAALARDRVGTARAKFTQALDHAPADAAQLRASLHFYHGLCLTKLDRSRQGRAEIRRALDAGFRPETVEEALLASRTLLHTGSADQAIPILEAVTLNRIQPAPNIWAMLGRAHQAEGNDALALSAFNESLHTAPDQPDVRALRGAVLRRIGDLDGAAADYEAALALDPASAGVRYALALVQFERGELDRARENMGQAAAGMESNAGAHLLHALLAATTGAHNTAADALQRYFGLAGTKANETGYLLEYVLAAANAPEAALRKLKGRAENASASPFLRNFIAYCGGELERKTVLDIEGKAETPEAARQQICSAAFWMAQHHKATADATVAEELLHIAVDVGRPEWSEYQLARWQTR